MGSLRRSQLVYHSVVEYAITDLFQGFALFFNNGIPLPLNRSKSNPTLTTWIKKCPNRCGRIFISVDLSGEKDNCVIMVVYYLLISGSSVEII